MGQPTADQAAQRALALGLLDEQQLQEVWSQLGTQNVSLKDFTQVLLRREFLTSYQLDKLTKGETSGYFYGKYKALYPVGAGSFARVFRAAHRTTGEIMALKVLRNRFNDKPEMIEQFMREGRVGLTLRHPNIVPTYEVATEGKWHYLVMEFVEGWNLSTFVKIRRVIEPLMAARLMIDMTEGLRYAFERGMTHRDLKLNNALVTSAGRAKLVDFGLAALDESVAGDLADDDAPGARTVDYAALERATGVRKDDTRSDIYFLGCILYHMLTGKAPLSETKDRMQRLMKTRFLEVVPIMDADPKLPHWICTVVNKAMTLDPARRYQTPAAMLSDLTLAEAKMVEEAGGKVAPREKVEEPSASAGDSGLNQKRHTVMVVESNQKLQDVFREGLKRVNYRVLMTSDPARAVLRFRNDAAAADVLLLSACEIGEPALTSFNALAEDEKTSSIRAVLLLDEHQAGWQKHAKVSERRRVFQMPIKLRELRQALAEMLDGVPVH